jgi:hypothetical protein
MALNPNTDALPSAQEPASSHETPTDLVDEGIDDDDIDDDDLAFFNALADNEPALVGDWGHDLSESHVPESR